MFKFAPSFFYVSQFESSGVGVFCDDYDNDLVKVTGPLDKMFTKFMEEAFTKQDLISFFESDLDGLSGSELNIYLEKLILELLRLKIIEEV